MICVQKKSGDNNQLRHTLCFKTRLTITLSILGGIWGVFSFLFRFGLERAPAPWEQLITLPETIVTFVWRWVFESLLGLPTLWQPPAALGVVLFLLIFLLPFLTGAVIGFLCAVSIEKLTSYARSRNSRKLTLASVSVLVALVAVMLVVTWAETTGDQGLKNCSLPYPDPEIVYSPDVPRVVNYRPDGFSWNLGVRCWLKLADESERVVVLKPWWDPSPPRATPQWLLGVTLMYVSILSGALVVAALGLFITERLVSLFHGIRATH